MAVELAKRAVEIDPNAVYIDTLAAAYAESGRFDEAVKTQEMVIGLLKRKDATGELDKALERLEGYRDENLSGGPHEPIHHAQTQK